MKIAGITTTRADWGHLYWPFRRIKESQCQFQLIVSGTHLSPQYGNTVELIEREEFDIDAKVLIYDELISDDMSVLKALSKAVLEFGRTFERLNPDLVLLLGDRYEVLGAAQAACICKIPIAHLAGGDVTEGAFDDSFRHAITKLSNIHFPTNAQSARRIEMMGENPRHIHNIGSCGLDFIKNMHFLTRDELVADLKLDLGQKNILITYHPETLNDDTVNDFKNLLHALELLPEEIGLIFTRANADPSSRDFSKILDEFIEKSARKRIYSFVSLGSVKYLSLLKIVDVLVGNSSSGIYEAPSLCIPTVNIGDRQKGRLAARSVLHCQSDSQSIKRALDKALEIGKIDVENPYGDGNSSLKLLQILESYKEENLSDLLQKQFFTQNQ